MPPVLPSGPLTAAAALMIALPVDFEMTALPT